MSEAGAAKALEFKQAGPTPEELLEGAAKKKERLGPWLATAICGNDITSSCLYVSGTAIVFAQFMAPVALLLVAGVLYLYRKIYTEVVEALPLDGGVYNCLLNSTRKFDASFAACLTLLSYMATAVISAKTAAEYLKTVLPVAAGHGRHRRDTGSSLPFSTSWASPIRPGWPWSSFYCIWRP